VEIKLLKVAKHVILGDNNGERSSSQSTFVAFVPPSTGVATAYICDTNTCQITSESVTVSVCGDGQISGIEVCDFGAGKNDAFTRSSLTTGYFAEYVAPTYGNSNNYTTCSASCNELAGPVMVTADYCGDGIKQEQEQCDFGSDKNTGLEDHRSRVADGSYVQFSQPAYGQTIQTSVCSSTCQMTTQDVTGGSCGDGIKQANEACDGEQYCAATCQIDHIFTSKFVNESISELNYFRERVQGNTDIRRVLESEIGRNDFQFISYARTITDLNHTQPKTHVAVVKLGDSNSARTYMTQLISRFNTNGFNMQAKANIQRETFVGGYQNRIPAERLKPHNANVTIFQFLDEVSYCPSRNLR
jgi:hypothetical protein